MNAVIIFICIIVSVAVPFLLAWQLYQLLQRSQGKAVRQGLYSFVKYFSIVTTVLYTVAAIAVHVYFVFVYQPTAAPTTSISPHDQRLMGDMVSSGIVFMFGGALSAAGLATLRHLRKTMSYLRFAAPYMISTSTVIILTDPNSAIMPNPFINTAVGKRAASRCVR